MGLWKKLSRTFVRYDSLELLEAAMNFYMGSYDALERASHAFEDLAERVDQFSEKEFEALKKRIPSLMMMDRGRATGVLIGGGLTEKQFESILSRAEVKSQLFYSAGFCRNTQKPPNYAKAAELLRKALSVRPKPRMYTLREVQADIKSLKVDVTDRIVTVESRHLPVFASENQVGSTADEVVSFRDVEFFGLSYLGLAKALVYGKMDLEEGSRACDVAAFYLEKTRHFDLNILVRGSCWFDKAMGNYYSGRWMEALEFYSTPRTPILENARFLCAYIPARTGHPRKGDLRCMYSKFYHLSNET